MSNEYIKYKDFVNLAPKEPGSVVRLQTHGSCSGSSKAFLVTRRDDGDVDCYCFRCGRSGYYSTSGKKKASEIRKARSKVTGKKRHASSNTPIYLPRDYTTDWREWSYEAQSWVRKADITDSETKKHRIGYSKFFNRIIIPCYSKGELVGYQTRQLVADGYPKYWTKRKDGQRLYKFIPNNKSSALFMVEDVLSAIKLSRYYNSLALLGTNIGSDIIHGLLPFKKVFIYMDNDNPRVKKLQSTLKARLELICDEVVLLKKDKDPKLLTDKEIIQLAN